MIKSRSKKIIARVNNKPLVFVVIIAGLGLLFLAFGSAATSYFSHEAESGNLAGSVEAINDLTASGNAGIKFGSQGDFVHPGILLTGSQLEFTKTKVASNEEPWKSAFARMSSNSLSSKNYTPQPKKDLLCSSGRWLNEYPQSGCSEINRDSVAAYTQALMYSYTGDVDYAEKAIQIMNAWASTLENAPFDQPRTSNGEPAYWQNLLTIGWSAENILRAAEIIRYNYNGWEQTEIAQFESMIRDIYLPVLEWSRDGSLGNGGETWSEALINAGIFLNDRQTYNKGVELWQNVSQGLVYLDRDGEQPSYPWNFLQDKPSWIRTPEVLRQVWRNPSQYIDGLQVETCRDMGHMMMGFGAMANAAETMYIQGDNFYSDPEYYDRFTKGLELNTDYVNQMLDRMQATGQTASQVTSSSWMPSQSWICPNFDDGGGSAFLGTEVAYNHFKNRLGINLPNTKKLMERNRPSGWGNHMVWETLTHANNP